MSKNIVDLSQRIRHYEEDAIDLPPVEKERHLDTPKQPQLIALTPGKISTVDELTALDSKTIRSKS